jgi:hypothetical protein
LELSPEEREYYQKEKDLLDAKENKKRENKSKIVQWLIVYGLLFIVLITVIIVDGNIGGSSSTSRRHYSADRKAYSQEIRSVELSITARLKRNLIIQAGSLEDGVAVLVSDLGAYWVKDGVVYGGNGFALSWSSKIDRDPVGIDFVSIERAATSR